MVVDLIDHFVTRSYQKVGDLIYHFVTGVTTW